MSEFLQVVGQFVEWAKHPENKTLLQTLGIIATAVSILYRYIRRLAAKKGVPPWAAVLGVTAVLAVAIIAGTKMLGRIWGTSATGSVTAPARQGVPSDPQQKPDTSRISADADRCLTKSGREAVGACDRIIASDDVGSVGRARAYYLRGRAWLEISEFDRAIADFDMSIRDAASAGKFNDRGTAWYYKGDMDHALADYEEAVRRDPENPLAYHNRGDARKEKGDLNGAVADYGKAISLDQAYTAAYADRGLAYASIGDLAQAAQDFRTAVMLPPKYSGDEQAQATARERLATLSPAAARRPTQNPVAPPPTPQTHAGGRRIALLIGNSTYASLPRLRNPARDVDLIAAALRRTGFDTVRRAIDLSGEQFLEALQSFTRDARQADWAVVYFAGHGIQIEGMNYLIPVDARLETDLDVKLAAISLSQVQGAVQDARKLRLIMLDACRDNPFISRMRLTTATRRITPGLAAPEMKDHSRASGELVVYATRPDQPSKDGWGENSPFAVAVAKNLVTPRLEVNTLLRIVHDDVLAMTERTQEPAIYESMPGREEFYFLPGGPQSRDENISKDQRAFTGTVQ